MRELLVAGMAYLDVFVPRVTAPAPGEEVFVDAIKLGFGGAANSASVAAALGLDVALCVPHGYGISDLALAALAQRLGIALAPLAAPDDPAISLVMSDAHDRAFISTASFGVLDEVDELPPARWILVPGLEEAARLAAPLSRARHAGARVAVCGSWAPHRLGRLMRQTGRPWDLLVLNEAEAGAACGTARDTPLALAAAAHSVVVTLGARGALGIIDGDAVSCSALEVPVLDTTGAGDALCAGLAAALMRGMHPAAALAFGARAAGHIVQQQGGLLHNPARIAALLKEIPWKH